MRSGGGQWILALLAGGSLLAVLLADRGPGSADRGTNSGRHATPPPTNPTTTQLGAGLVGIRTDNVGHHRATRYKPDAYIGYLLPFEIISVHLLVVLVGAAFLARAKRRVEDQGTGAGGNGVTGVGEG